MTVEQTLKYLQKYGEENENIYDLYVVDNFDKIKGVISLKELVTTSFETRISDIVHTKVEGILFNDVLGFFFFLGLATLLIQYLL